MMTRVEYVREAQRYLGPSAPTVSEVMFVMFLSTMAARLFIDRVYETPLANETRRRLIQLEELGYTDL